MKRTTEFTLGIIGTILSALSLLFGLVLNFLFKSDEALVAMEQEIQNNPEVDAAMLSEILGMFSSYSVLLAVASALGLIFGIIGTVSIKGNKKPVLAGWMFIIGALLVGILSIGFAFLPGLLFLIAGIMAFARKPKVNGDLSV